jgi:hypothetical protein
MPSPPIAYIAPNNISNQMRISTTFPSANCFMQACIVLGCIITSLLVPKCLAVETIVWSYDTSAASRWIAVGEEVTWTFGSDGLMHSIVSDDDLFHSGEMASGSFSFTFNHAGFYPYHCGIHPSMHAGILVTDGMCRHLSWRFEMIVLSFCFVCLLYLHLYHS